MQIIRTALAILAAAATTAGAQDSSSYARTEGGQQLDAYKLLVSNFEIGQPESPKVLLRWENPFGATVLSGAKLAFKIEWTANGEVQPTDIFLKRARCTGSGTELWCTGLSNWFRPPPGASGERSRTWVNPEEFSQGFYFFNLEYDTRYCVRLQATAFAPAVVEVTNPAPWSRWTCVRTPPPPAPIPAAATPEQPTLTLLPATDGKGVQGGALPVRVLLEWDIPQGLEHLNLKYRIERTRFGSAPEWHAVQSELGGTEYSREATVAFAADEEPTTNRRYLFRVCAYDATGSRCSTASSTASLTPDPLAQKRTIPLPSGPADVTTSTTADAGPTRAPVPRICELAKTARARNSPATAGLEKQCVAAGGSVPAAPPPQPSNTTPLKAQPRVRVDAQTGATSGTSDGPPAAVTPENIISVRVMYPRSFGFKTSTNAFGDVGETSCGAFSITAAPASGARPRQPIGVTSDSRMTVIGEKYVCNYVISNVPLDDPYTITAVMVSSELFVVWQGGATPQPPAGQVRTIVDATRTATLNSRQPRARLVYEMTYAPATGR